MPFKKQFIYDRLPGYPACHGSTIAERENGELIAAWFGGTKESHPDSVVLYGRKPAGTDEWQDIRPVFGMQNDRPYGNAVLYVDHAKPGEPERIHMFYIRSEDTTGRGWCGDCMTYTSYSIDGGWTWSEPKLMRDQWSFLVKNKPYRLSNGDLAIPAYSDREHNSWFCTLAPGSDQWQFHGPVGPPVQNVNLIQAGLAVWPDDELQMYFRTHGNRVWRSRSFDLGRTWEEAVETELPHPGAGLDVQVLPDGRLAIVYNPTEKGRSPLWLRLSEDRGQTWGKHYVLEDEEGEFSYPAVMLADDGTLHVTYTHLRTRVMHASVSYEKL